MGYSKSIQEQQRDTLIVTSQLERYWIKREKERIKENTDKQK